MSSLAQRRKAHAEEKERVKNRLAAMELLLQNTYVRVTLASLGLPSSKHLNGNCHTVDCPHPAVQSTEAAVQLAGSAHWQAVDARPSTTCSAASRRSADRATRTLAFS